MLTLLSEKCGPIRFSRPPDFEGEEGTYRTYLAETAGGGKIKMEVVIRPDFQAELITLQQNSDDRLDFTEVPWPYTLIFIFGYSVTLYLSHSLKKEIHDRGGHLFHTTNRSYQIRFQKNRNYLIISIHYSASFVQNNLEETAQSIRHRWEFQSPVFYYSRSRITGRESLELISMLILPAPPELSEEFLIDELARAILMDFLQDSGISFQPAYLAAKHFESFYKERDALFAKALQNLSLSKLLISTGIRDVPLFRKRLRQLYDLNIREFVTETRMTSALKLLHDPTLSIKEISDKTGYSSPSYFSRVFAIYFGLSPKTFRMKSRL